MHVGIDIAIGQLLQIIPVLNGQDLPLDCFAPRNIQLHLRGDRALAVMGGDQLHISLVMTALDFQRGYFNLLHKAALVGVHGVKPVYHMMLVGMGGGIAQGAKRVHGSKRRFACAFEATINALRFINDDDRIGRLNQVNRLFTTGILILFIEVVNILLVDRANGGDHDLDRRAGGEIAHLAELGRIVEKILIALRLGIEVFEMVAGDLERFVGAFLDRDGRHDNHEFGEAIFLIELKDGAQIDIGFACARLHLDGEIARLQQCFLRQAIAKLHIGQIFEQFFIDQLEPIADAQIAFDQAQIRLRAAFGAIGDGKFGTGDFLPFEQVNNRSNGRLLIV